MEGLSPRINVLQSLDQITEAPSDESKKQIDILKKEVDAVQREVNDLNEKQISQLNRLLEQNKLKPVKSGLKVS